jgi:MFS family permease
MSRVWRTWSVLVLFALGTSLITPLIPLYQDRLGFSDTVVTLFLGCYVVTLVPSMLTLGQVPDRIGRRAVLLGAIATLAVAQVLLITEPDLEGLLIACGIQGLATGAFFGT